MLLYLLSKGHCKKIFLILLRLLQIEDCDNFADQTTSLSSVNSWGCLVSRFQILPCGMAQPQDQSSQWFRLRGLLLWFFDSFDNGCFWVFESLLNCFKLTSSSIASNLYRFSFRHLLTSFQNLANGMPIFFYNHNAHVVLLQIITPAS